MAKLADALDLGSSSERSEGSSPFIRTCKLMVSLKTLGKMKSYQCLCDILY